MKIKTVRFTSVFLTLSLCFSCFFCSCAPSPPDYFAYTERQISAELAGSLYGKEFSAKIAWHAGEGGRIATIEYLKLTELQGISVCARFDEEGQPKGQADVTFQSLTHARTASSVAGLLTPLAALLAVREPSTVSYSEEEYTLTFENGDALTVNKEGIPQRFHAQNVDFWIVWWENEE